MKKILFLLLFLGIVAVVNAEQRNYDVEYSYVEAIRNREAGNLNASVYILGSILRVDSACSACYYELSRIYRESGALPQAINFAARSCALDTANYWYLKNYIDLVLSAGDTLDALPLLRRLIHMPNAGVDDLIMFASLSVDYKDYRSEGQNVVLNLSRAKDAPEVLHLFFLYRKLSGEAFKSLSSFLDSCVIVYPDYPVFVLDRAVLFAENKKFRQSRHIFMNILQTDTFYYDAIYAFARYFGSHRDEKFVFDYFDKFFSGVDPDSRQLLLTRMIRANNVVFDRYLSDRLTDFASRDTFSESFFDAAFDFYLRRNQMESLIVLGQRFVNLYPDNVSAWGRFILPLFVLGKFNTLDSILTYRPQAFNSPFAMYVAGMIYYRRNDYIRSRDYFVRCLKVEGNFGYKPVAINLLADYYYRNGMRDSAFYYYEIAVQQDFADETILNNYAYYLSLTGRNLNKAEMMARAAVMKYPKNSAFLDTYAWILYLLRRYDDALIYMQKALKYMGDDERRELLEHYAAILYCSGNQKKADKLMRSLFSDPTQRTQFFKTTIICD